MFVGSPAAHSEDLVEGDSEGPDVALGGVLAEQHGLPGGPAQRQRDPAVHLVVITRVRFVVRTEVTDLHLITLAD